MPRFRIDRNRCGHGYLDWRILPGQIEDPGRSSASLWVRVPSPQTMKSSIPVPLFRQALLDRIRAPLIGVGPGWEGEEMAGSQIHQ